MIDRDTAARRRTSCHRNDAHGIWPKRTAILALFVCIWLARSFYTQPIEAGGDATKKWTYVATFFDPSTDTLANHHTMRWAVNLPGVAFSILFGTKPVVYYLVPLTAFSVGFVLLCAIAWRRLPPHLVVAFAILLFLEPMMHRASTQFQPIAFGFAYLSACLWCVLQWSHHKRPHLLVISALFLFLAYGAKAPYGYFLPGVLLLVWKTGGLRAATIWIALFALLFNIEALVFNCISDRDLPLGRLSAILSTHNPATGFGHYRYAEYFTMWLRISWFDQLITLMALAPFAFLVVRGRTEQLSPELFLLCVCLASYHLLNTFLIVDFDATMTPQPPQQKYLAVTMPFACLASTFWIHSLAERCQTRQIDAAIVVASVGLLAFHLLFGVQPSYWHNRIRYPSRDATLYRINRHYQEGAEWLEKRNLITTNYPDKVDALRVLLAPYLPKDQPIAVDRRNGQFLMRLADQSEKQHPQVSKYWFSQREFIRIVDDPEDSSGE